MPMKKYVTHFDSNPDMEKDASAARGSFWLMRKFGTRNKKKCVKFLRKFILNVESRPNVSGRTSLMPIMGILVYKMQYIPDLI